MHRNWTLLAAGMLFTVTACASMPDHGKTKEVTRGDAVDQRTDRQVRVFAVPPSPGDQPGGLVKGFLEAVTSDEPNYATARKYLTPQAQEQWKPDSSITVLETILTPKSGPATPDPAVAGIEVKGRRIGGVDTQHAYQSTKPEDVIIGFTLLKGADGQWRINDLPQGLVLSQADFQRIYKSVNTYWFARPDDEAKRLLVPDPLYLRGRVGLLTALAEQQLAGPTPWLAPVVGSEFPAGTRLADGPVTVDEEGAARIVLTDEARRADAERCGRMAAQMFYTLAQNPTPTVTSVELATRKGGTLCRTEREDARKLDPVDSRSQPTGYFLTRDKHAMVLPWIGDAFDMTGKFGNGAYKFSALAVSRDQKQIAGVLENGQGVVVGDTKGETEPVEWVRSATPSALSSPSWDGRGALWLVDASGGGSQVVMLASGQRIPVTVQGQDGRVVSALRISPDGTRAAMVLTRGDSVSVVIGRVERGIDRGKAVVSVKDLRPVMPALKEAKSVSWNGASRLAVLGREENGTLQPQLVDIDGGRVVAAAPIGGMQHLASPDGADQPLLADSSDGQIYRLAQGNSWTAVWKAALYPVYPG